MDGTAFVRLRRGGRIEAEHVRFTGNRQCFQYFDHPKPSANHPNVREFDLSLLLSDMTFKIDIELRKYGYVNAGGSATGQCILEKDRTLS